MQYILLVRCVCDGDVENYKRSAASAEAKLYVQTLLCCIIEEELNVQDYLALSMETAKACEI